MSRGIINKISGECGETAAVEYLKKKKYKIIERNFSAKTGEIDIIAQKGEDLVFVEVKTRSSEKFGTPAQAVTYYKKRNFVNTAKWYLVSHPTELNIRFDIIEVYGVFAGDKFVVENINHLEQVFAEV
ncbi:MAG: YraN family protein [Clostridia bacterium]|nr:YraN family protein [Clostridia bacterium]